MMRVVKTGVFLLFAILFIFFSVANSDFIVLDLAFAKFEVQTWAALFLTLILGTILGYLASRRK